MSDINPAQSNRVRYYLQHNSVPRLLIDESEVDGWNDDDKEYARNDDYDGIFAQFSNNLTFYDSAKEFINTIRKSFGVNARIRLIKEVKSQEDIWLSSYTGLLDLSTWNSKKGGVACKFNSSDLQKQLKARQNDKIEIERNTDLAGNPLPDLVVKELELDGRRIFLNSKWKQNPSSNNANCQVSSNDGNTRNQTCGLPIVLDSQSHDNAQSVTPLTNASEDVGTTGIMFYANNDRDRTLLIDIDFSLTAFFQQYENVQWCFYRVALTTYKDGVSYNLKSRLILDQLDSGFSDSDPRKIPQNVDYPYPQFSKSMGASWSGEIELLENESLALEVILKSDMYADNNAGVRVFANNVNANVNINEDSSYPKTKTKGVLAHELFERILRITTNKEDVFKSSILGRLDLGYNANGRAAYTFNTHGMWVRRFDSDNPLYKPFTTSFKDAFDSYNTAYCLGLGIESIGYGEKIIIEDKRYFWNPNVTIRLGSYDENGVFEYDQVNNVERYLDDKRYFSSINIGSEKGGDYEEVMGLQETNTKSNFITEIEAIENTYEMLSKYRFDPYGQEGERRRGVETHPDSDRSADLDIWMNDVKPGPTDVLLLKKWSDVLVSEPIGMFDPDSSYNFIYSPLQMLLEHDWVLNAGLQEYPNAEIVYGSSTGNSSVIQHRFNREPYAENGNITNSDLRKARYSTEIIEFEYPVNDDLIKLVEGKSSFFGVEIPNVYGLIEFMNEDREIEKGFLLNLKPNKKGKWKLLKFNK